MEDISPSVSVETVLMGAGSGSRHCGRSWLTIRVGEPHLNTTLVTVVAQDRANITNPPESSRGSLLSWVRGSS